MYPTLVNMGSPWSAALIKYTFCFKNRQFFYICRKEVEYEVLIESCIFFHICLNTVNLIMVRKMRINENKLKNISWFYFITNNDDIYKMNMSFYIFERFKQIPNRNYAEVNNPIFSPLWWNLFFKREWISYTTPDEQQYIDIFIKPLFLW